MFPHQGPLPAATPGLRFPPSPAIWSLALCPLPLLGVYRLPYQPGESGPHPVGCPAPPRQLAQGPTCCGFVTTGTHTLERPPPVQVRGAVWMKAHYRNLPNKYRSALSTLPKLGNNILCYFYIVLSLSASYWDKNEVFRLLRWLFGLECPLGSSVLSD